MADDLSPLPLTPFEFYYWCDDRPEYPTTFPLELLFRGRLRKEEFEAAVQIVLRRHPLLRANVDVSAGKIPNWVSSDDVLPPLDWADGSQPIDYASQRTIDLSSSIGLRLWVRTSVEKSRVVLQFHHACCDALGALQVVEDLLIAYDSLVAGTDPHARLRPLDSQRLASRDDYGLTEAGYRPSVRDALTTARFWARRLTRRPALLAVPQRADPAPTDDVADLGFLTHTFSRQDQDRLQALASQHQVTVNDLLLRDLLLTLREWNREQGGASRRLVVNMPVSLRTRPDRQMPATNVLGFWFLDRGERDCDDAEQLLLGIRDEIAAVRKWRLPLHFVGGLALACRFPAIVRRVLRSDRSFASIVLSNAGRVLAHAPLKRQEEKLVCGDVLLDRITGVPPVRPGTRATLLVANYGPDTTINMNWDAQALDESAAQQFLAAYVARLSGSR